MAVEVVMPQMGESVVEGTITGWLVKEGDQVTEDQPLVAISTDKVDTEIPSPAAGSIVRIVAKEGETLPIGALLAVIETAGAPAGVSAAAAKPAAARVPAAQAEASAQAAPPDVQAKPPQPAATRPAVNAVAPDGDGRGATVRERTADARESGAAARYSPLVLKIAGEHGIDLRQIHG